MLWFKFFSGLKVFNIIQHGTIDCSTVEQHLQDLLIYIGLSQGRVNRP